METISIDWMTIISVVWTAILLPIITYVGKELNEYFKSKKIDKYTDILYDEIKKAVKCVYESVVKDIKGTDGWTQEKKNEVKELAKSKAIQGLSSAGYRILKQANSDFEEYIDNLIDTALYDIKHE